jgi:hypothetical protein
MKNRIGFLTILLLCISVVFAISCTSNQQATDSKGRPVISPGEKALAAIEVQNVFSKHCYYHEAGKHRAEMEDIWVRKDGEFAKTVKWTQPMGINVGYDALWSFYVLNKEKSLQQNLDDISKADPTVKNMPENLGIGGEWASHTQSTAIIVVADDGKTAKGIWESPGLHFTAQVRDGKITKSGSWFWEKYGADFVKEDGKWKIWHISMYYENTPPGWDADTNSYQAGGRVGQGGMPPAGAQGRGRMGGMPPAGGQGPGGQAARGGAPAGAPGGAGEVGKVSPDLAPQTQVAQMYSENNPNPYQAWSPTKLPIIDPKFPEPYYTFSETFSY